MIDDSKLRQIVEQCGGENSHLLKIAQAIWREAQAEERERCAKIAESVNNYDNPMTAQDVADAIREGANHAE